MTRAEYMRTLQSKLAKKMTESEISDALSYYNEYFDDAGPENEMAVIAELGDPKQVASDILSEHAIAAAEEQPQSMKKGLSAVWIVILSLFAAPIALPLALALVAVMLAMFLAVFAVVISFLVALLAIFVSGIVLVVLGLVLFFKSFFTGLIYFGSGLVMVGVTLVFLPAIVWVSNKVFRALAELFNKLANKIRGRSKKNEPTGEVA